MGTDNPLLKDPSAPPPPLYYQSVFIGRVTVAWLSVLLIILLLLVIYYTAQRSAVDQLRESAAYHMIRLNSAIDAALERHEYLPALLAQNEVLRDFLGERGDLSAEQVSMRLRTMSEIAHTLDIYLMNTNGITLSSSNWDKSYSFVGQNFAFRPYFRSAMHNGNGRYFALGTNSGERGYYFSARVNDDHGQPLGVVVVKIGVGQLEAQWRDEVADFMVTDEYGVIFMASRPAWRLSGRHTPGQTLRSLLPLSQENRRKLQSGRRYSTRIPEALHEFTVTPLDHRYSKARINGEDYLLLKSEQAYGWDVYILADWKHVIRSVILALSLAIILLALTGLLVYLLWKNQQQRRRYEQQVLVSLETKVEERTRELRRTQEELVQAAKMAALGQLSAAITHEINNPLSAIRAYTDNASQFLQLGQNGMAEANLQEIAGLTDRMATITRQLKTFSRKSKGRPERCDLHQALDSALLIVQPQLSQRNVILQQAHNPEARWVLADLVWLEQILVNLFSNAIDAVVEQDRGVVWSTAEYEEGAIYVRVADNGDGISEGNLAHVFEAFFTTKSAGKGLGLGLSISSRLAQDMGGELTASNRKQGGAVFSLRLISAPE